MKRFDEWSGHKLKYYINDLEVKHEKDVEQLKQENEKLKENVKELEKLADSWMIDYQILKDKYEPEILVIQTV